MTNTARITSPNNRTHFIAMAGMRGYMPNYCDVYADYNDAVDGLIQLHDMYDDEIDHERIAELRDTGWCDLDIHEHGNEYAEVTECDCDDPGLHSDDMYTNPDDWYAENDPDHALRVLENAIPDNSPFWQKLAIESITQWAEYMNSDDQLFPMAKSWQFIALDRRKTNNAVIQRAKYEQNETELYRVEFAPDWLQAQIVSFYEKRYSPNMIDRRYGLA